MAMLGCRLLGIDEPRRSRRLIVYVEIDRCATDAIAAVTGCRLGKRTLKFYDYGKLAATFVDTQTGRAVRIVGRDEVRERALRLMPSAPTRAAAQLAVYQSLPDDELFTVQDVEVILREEDLPGPPVSRVTCERCGEGINDRREVQVNGQVLCRACAGEAYYRLRQDAVAV